MTFGNYGRKVKMRNAHVIAEFEIHIHIHIPHAKTYPMGPQFGTITESTREKFID